MAIGLRHRIADQRPDLGQESHLPALELDALVPNGLARLSKSSVMLAAALRPHVKRQIEELLKSLRHCYPPRRPFAGDQQQVRMHTFARAAPSGIDSNQTLRRRTQ
jgi:hypothetical protein